MQHPKEPYDRLFDRFNACFARIAEQENLNFQQRAGPNIGRTLRFKNDLLKRGIFLELKYNWSKSDPGDPLVTLGYGAWLQPKPNEFPFHFFSKVFYEGNLGSLQEQAAETMLRSAVSEIRLVSREQVILEGKTVTDWPKDAGEAGSYYL